MKDINETDIPDASTAVSAEERHRLISEAAYYRAEQRGFLRGCELQDWLDSEAEVDAIIDARTLPAKTQQA